MRGGNAALGAQGTWALGITWIVLCITCKFSAIIVDRKFGVHDSDGKLRSFRRIFAARFCTVEGYGMMLAPHDYDASRSFLVPTPPRTPLGVDCAWVAGPAGERELRMALRRADTDRSPNGLAGMLMKSVALLYEGDSL